MIRLWRDSTAPRRLDKTRGDRRRIDEALLEAEADLVRDAWKTSNRVGPF